jgi:hypothetical protein
MGGTCAKRGQEMLSLDTRAVGGYGASFELASSAIGCEITRGAVRSGPAGAGVEKRAFRLAGRDPRRVPDPPRSSGCRRVLPDRVTPAHAGLREQLPGFSRAQPNGFVARIG